MQPDGDVDEALLIAAFSHRQQIEASKMLAIITAITRPDKAPEAFMEFLRKLMPDYDALRDEMDAAMRMQLSADAGHAFALTCGPNGFVAKKVAIEGASK